MKNIVNTPKRSGKRISGPNNVRINGDTAYIELTDRSGKHVQDALVHVDDLERVQAIGRWNISQQSNTMYAISCAADRPPVKLHHAVMGQVEAGLVIDHRNHDGLDNRRCNLEWVSRQLNAQRRRGANRDSRSGVRGLTHDTERDSWKIQIVANGKRARTGRYKNFDDACAAALATRLITMPNDTFDSDELRYRPATMSLDELHKLVVRRLTRWSVATGQAPGFHEVQLKLLQDRMGEL